MRIIPHLQKIRAKVLASFAIMALFLTVSVHGASATTLTLGTEYASTYKIAEPSYHPEPEISPELHEQCFKSSCVAKFVIKKDGQTSVSLLSSSGSQEVDDIALNTLRHWKFKPATLDGQAVDSSRKIKVEFEVE